MDSITHSSQPVPQATDLVFPHNLVAAVSDALDVESIRQLRADNNSILSRLFRIAPTLEIRGRLLMAPDRAYEIVAARFRALGHVALFRKDGDTDVVLAAPGSLPVISSRPWLAIGLFVATLLSVLYVGAASEPSFDGNINLMAGLPFAASLLGILLAHEFGHYLMARRLGVPASLPHFLPLPLPPFGTLGAVIVMKVPPRDKRKLLAVAIAGPLSGLVIAIPVLIVGLLLSPVQTIPAGMSFVQEGNSLLYASIKFLLFGRLLPSGGVDVFLHPIAFGAWAGLFVTGLNLIPAGQLDGGHVVYALFGERARHITSGVIVTLLVLSTLWLGWLLWAALVFIFGRVQATPLDDITPLRPVERALAIMTIIVFVLVFMPIPLS